MIKSATLHVCSLYASSLALLALVSFMPLFASPVDADKHSKIAIIAFELDDHSAGGGIIPEDDLDRENLKAASEEAMRLLEATGKYDVIEAHSADREVASHGGVISCDGCEVEAARKLGAAEVLVGVITRVNRTEYTLFIRVKNVASATNAAIGFTGLRLGANYAWPRGVTWLMNNGILAQLDKA